MSNYIRSKAPGAAYFFTAHLADRNSTLLTDEINLLRHAMRCTLQRYPFEIDAIVILPSTIHTIWHLSEGDADYSRRWSFLKSTFSRSLPVPEHRSALQKSRKEKGIWQRRFWEHKIRSAQDLALHRNLVHTAPVQRGFVATPSDWTWTSVHRDLADAHRAANPAPPQRFSSFQRRARSPAA
ncbi:REP-associated tyrosine transposase [Roseobacter fucihabitans]|uniref:REP-associated tyrosine transposase n=1 Tax=Roseobacter fucihabitans TaxID=1537242 RepID=A0ABZ2BTA7_9RHOB|nr:transposase [Roseobacter litoralis]MBC6964295.1 hypothetical protein [Roseobacter litoralis]